MKARKVVKLERGYEKDVAQAEVLESRSLGISSKKSRNPINRMGTGWIPMCAADIQSFERWDRNFCEDVICAVHLLGHLER